MRRISIWLKVRVFFIYTWIVFSLSSKEKGKKTFFLCEKQILVTKCLVIFSDYTFFHLSFIKIDNFCIICLPFSVRIYSFFSNLSSFLLLTISGLFLVLCFLIVTNQASPFFVTTTNICKQFPLFFYYNLNCNLYQWFSSFFRFSFFLWQENPISVIWRVVLHPKCI